MLFAFVRDHVPKEQRPRQGSPWNYDSHVPLLIRGDGIRPGRYSMAVTPAASTTLARLLDLEPPAGCEVEALSEAILPRPPAKSPQPGAWAEESEWLAEAGRTPGTSTIARLDFDQGLTMTGRLQMSHFANDFRPRGYGVERIGLRIHTEAEHHHHLQRRPGFDRPELLRCEGPDDAEPGCVGRAWCAIHANVPRPRPSVPHRGPVL